ncbi:MAG: transglutaminase domain-containing protein [Planctomycetes bacterium]|nr:transglutaminase domain-containing protein [Planctomycetota bacterium]
MISAFAAMAVHLIAMELAMATIPSHAAEPAVEPVLDDTAIVATFEAAQTARLVRLGRDGVELYDRELIEDDGPGGNSWDPEGDVPKGIVRGPLQARKILHIRRPACRGAHLTLAVWPINGETEPLEVTLNGDPSARWTILPGNVTVDGWRTIDLPSAPLRRGDNTFVLTCRGSSGWGVGVARREDIARNDPDRRNALPRSFASADGGQKWVPGIAAEGEPVDGEYMIRLAMDQYSAEGDLIGPVIDLAARDGVEPVVAAPVGVQSVRLVPVADTPAGTAVRLALRSGPGPVVDDEWSPWRNADADNAIRGPHHRFVQWRATLRTDDPVATPVLKDVAVEADTVTRPFPWAEGITVRSSHNETIRYTSIPFEYERFDEPQLVELRRKYKLDEVVAGATSELDKMRKLQAWVSRQWVYDPPQSPYPAWDADAILQRRDGFCVQYAIVYMQCALSLGMQTRFVFGIFPDVRVNGQFICGHEVCEYWSNEYGKWVMVDPNQNELFLDAATGVPLSMLELRAELLRLYSPDRPLSFEPLIVDELKPSTGLLLWKGGEAAPQSDPPRMAVKWGCMHWMPRNNMFAHRYPEPIAQGRAPWAWTGYWNWDDGLTPRSARWSNYTGRTSDLDWSLNQVRWAAQTGIRPGKVTLRLGTVTPDLDTFLARIDGGDWLPVGPSFPWTLHEGTNRIDLRTRNRAGVLGVISHIELDYAVKKD